MVETGEEIHLIRYGLIGCGRIAANHIKAACACKEIEVAALCDCKLEKAEQLAGAISPCPACYSDYQEMLEHEGLDLVAVATDSGLHGTIAAACLWAGCSTLVEKPIALSLAEAENLLSLARKKGLLLAVCHQNRFNRAVQRVKEAVDAGELGRMYHLSASILWNRGESYYRQAQWRGRWESDGGVLMNQCIHNIDLLRYLGGEVAEVFAYTDRLAHPYIEAEDLGLALLRFQNGSYGVLEGTSNVFPENLEETLSLYGERGTARIGGKSVNRLEIFRTEAGERDLQTFAETPENIYGFGHGALYRDVVEALETGKQPLCSGEDGYKALELVLAIYQSAAEHRPVQLPLAEGWSGSYKGRFDR